MDRRDEAAPRYVAVDARYASRARALPRRARRYAASAYSPLDEDAAGSVPLEFEDDFDLDDELKMEFDRSARAHRRPQRMKYVKCKTRVPPDLLVPYLYGGDRHSRVNAIIERTDCMIDYCPESPSDDVGELAVQRNAGRYIMSFLVGAETSEQLEAASRMLFVLVDRVQAHVENKIALNALHRANEVESTTIQSDHQSGSRSEEGAVQRSVGYDHRRHGMIRSRYLKAEPADPKSGVAGAQRMEEGCESMAAESPLGSVMHPRHDRQWIQEDSQTGAPSPQDLHMHVDFHHQDQHYRPRYVGARYRRPLYRRILVDEDGYEVMERNPYERVQLLSPRASAHPGSPQNHRRSREQFYRHGSSSDEESQLHPAPSLPLRASMPPPRKLPGLDDLPSRGMVHEGLITNSTRRGLKRRLDAYEYEDIYPRQRVARRGSFAYDVGVEDLGEEFLSEDDFDDDDLIGSSIPPSHSDEGYQPQSSRPGTHSQGVDVSKHPPPSSPLQVGSCVAEGEEEQAKPPAANNDVVLDHSQTPNEASSLSIDQEGNCRSEEQEMIVTSGVESSSSRGKPDDPTDNAHSSASEPEQVAAGSVMPLSVHRVDPHSDTQLGSDSSALANALDETHVNFALQVTSELHNDANEAIDPDVVVARESCSPLIYEPSSISQRQHARRSASLDEMIQKPTPRIRLNIAMTDRLECHSRLAFQTSEIQTKLLSIAQRTKAFKVRAESHQHLSSLADAAQRIEVEIWRQKDWSLELKRAITSRLDSVVHDVSDTSKTPSQRVSTLLCGLDDLITREIIPMMPTNVSKLPASTDEAADRAKCTSDPQIRSPLMGACAVQGDGELGNAKEDCNYQGSKLRAITCSNATNAAAARLTIPTEAPSFVSGLVVNLERTSGLSQVMASAQKRLLREISKSDPYYYLHPILLTETVRKGRGSSCPFGCVGASAHKWERKVVSQISSRMKWFDSVAYSLAKVSAGKELLSRKKMNSTIRKLHLVALQLHCLIAHLYCIRKRATCREIDSLPTALNNSYYEKRMNGYKSRLKLTLHQQQSPSVPGSLPTEELVRDTFEFYPELLLAVDVWGYDYRQSEGKIPTSMLESASRQCFDFENDVNGLLQGICEELLSILCRWNDFKWGESLESLNVEDIVVFEANVKTSIRKILEAHASHLLSQWSQQLSANSHMLGHIRLTQSNVYYSEQTLNMAPSVGLILADLKLSQFREEEEEEDSTGDQNEEEMALLHEMWRDKPLPPSSSIMQEVHSDEVSATPLNLSLLREEDLVRSSEAKNHERVLSWTQMYDMRQHCHKLAERVGRMIADKNQPSEPSPDLSSSDHVSDLLNRLARARFVVEDAIRTSEKLALHSLNHQLDNRKDVRDGDSALGAGSLADIESMSEGSRDGDDAIVDAVLTGPTATDRITTNNNDDPTEPDSNGDSADWKQPVMKDLVEIVTSTNQEMTEICGQRARSARVRDKLQSQSLELARQSIQIFETILNMSP